MSCEIVPEGGLVDIARAAGRRTRAGHLRAVATGESGHATSDGSAAVAIAVGTVGRVAIAVVGVDSVHDEVGRLTRCLGVPVRGWVA